MNTKYYNLAHKFIVLAKCMHRKDLVYLYLQDTKTRLLKRGHKFNDVDSMIRLIKHYI